MPDITVSWPECQSSLMRGLETYSDRQLLTQFQQDPTQARYFIGLFCRYAPVVERILVEAIADKTCHPAWRHRVWQVLHQALQTVDPPQVPALSSWITTQVEQVLSQSLEPGEGAPLGSLVEGSLVEGSLVEGSLVEGSGLSVCSPVLTCYLMLGLKAIAPDLRFVLILRDRFHWTTDQIAEQLTQEGYPLTPEETQTMMTEARQQLFQALPLDIRALYLTHKP